MPWHRPAFIPHQIVEGGGEPFLTMRGEAIVTIDGLYHLSPDELQLFFVFSLCCQGPNFAGNGE